MRNSLLSGTAASTRWPDDREFEAAWLDRPVYEMLTASRIRMLMEALEVQIRTEMTEPAPVPPKLQVEHILPQTWPTYWPLPEGQNGEEADRKRNVLLHTIGNLTLLTEKLNPSVSNAPWIEKRAAILQHTVLRLNLNLATYETWNEEAIKQRGKLLFSAATKIWPRPGKEVA